MTPKQEHDTTGNNTVYKKRRRVVIRGFCTLCPWHGGENASRKPRRSSWKKNRQSQHKR